MEESKMNVYETKSFEATVKGNSYVGRGIVIGMSKDAKKAVSAYFIMGRSVNSRNRVFDKTEDGIIIHAFEPEKLSDPSLVIYSPVRRTGKHLIVTNGDQTDTIFDYVEAADRLYGGCCKGAGSPEEALKFGVRPCQAFDLALATREFEPDGPNWTPRISGMLTFFKNNSFKYKMSILKSADAEGTACNRYSFDYLPLAGLGHFIHTYNCDGNPIPTFTGEPERVEIPDDIDAFTNEIWDSLDAENKVSLYVTYTDLENGKEETRIINKNVK